MSNPKYRLSFDIIFILTALAIIVDFILPGKIIQDNIVDVKKERQQHYNAARKYHYTYEIITNEHRFFVAKDFVELIKNEDKIEFSVSRIFKEVNWYRFDSTQNKSIYSLRILSGLILPLLVVVFILASILLQKDVRTLIFVVQLCLIADVMFLMM